MKTIKTFLFISTFIIFSGNSYASEPATDLMQLLPPASNTEWRLEGTPQTAEGMQLFMLINGGAELYLQKGFKRALIATFLDKKGQPYNIDIYQMNSAEIAKETNKEKTGENATEIAFGNDAQLESYYLNFWKGPYQVTVSASDESAAAQNAIKVLAKIVADRINE